MTEYVFSFCTKTPVRKSKSACRGVEVHPESKETISNSFKKLEEAFRKSALRL